MAGLRRKRLPSNVPSLAKALTASTRFSLTNRCSGFLQALKLGSCRCHERTEAISVELKIMSKTYPYDEVVAPTARE
jgi:hypothetical protein